MTITAKVIAHSRVQGAPDLITLQARYPRFIHAEAKTHRIMSIDDAFYEFLQEISFMDDEDLSRNASSSRAVPIERMIQDVLDDPAMPEVWGANKPGMQDGGEHNELIELASAGRDVVFMTPVEAWLEARDRAVAVARAFAAAGYHKQVVNRLLEPFGHITVVVTATEWDNFFTLRRHSDADPTMRVLAEAMWDAISASKPAAWGHDEGAPMDWHLPYVSPADAAHIPSEMSGQETWEFLAMISAARCARVSYLNHDGTAPNIEKDLKLAKMLLDSKHMSPFEHQAQVAEVSGFGGYHYEHLQGNFTGWNQHRKFLELAA